MKIRTDFVTNSSSSSFITIIAYMKDGTTIESHTHMDDIGHGVEPCTFAYMNEEDILGLLNKAKTGNELIAAIDNHYDGMFRLIPETALPDDTEFDSDEEEEQADLCKIRDMSDVEELFIEDEWSGDYGEKRRYFIYDPSKKILKNGKKKTEISNAIEEEISSPTESAKETPAKEGTTIQIKARFEDNKSYSYLCKFRVSVGDKVFVQGKKAGIPGTITEILDTYPSGKAAKYTLHVEKAYNVEAVASDNATHRESVSDSENTENNEIDKNPNPDFIVENGVLVEYRGSDAKVVIPDGVKTIGEKAFYKKNIRSVLIPKSVVEIPAWAFGYCDKLVEIINHSTIPISINSRIVIDVLEVHTEPGRFIDNDDGYVFYQTVDECVLVDYTGHEINLVLPSDCEGHSYRINRYAFSNQKSIQSVIIPECVTEIGYHAFQGCSALHSVKMTDSVTEIDLSAFADCSALKDINISESIKKIGSYAFRNCSALRSVKIPEGVAEIGSCVFENCSALCSVNIPEGVTEIDGFNNCSSLETITLPNSATKIGSYAFSGCSALKRISIPSGVTEIGSCAFGDCKSLKEVVIYSSAVAICKDAFENSSPLICCKEIKELPKEIRGLAIKGFIHCYKKGDVSIQDVDEYKAYIKRHYKQLDVKQVNPNDVLAYMTAEGLIQLKAPKNNPDASNQVALTIAEAKKEWNFKKSDDGTYMIKGYVGANNKIHIPSEIGKASVTSIGNKAFAQCSFLTDVIIPDSVVEIGNNAFEGCTSLTNVVLPQQIKRLSDSIFENCSALQTIIVPNGVKEVGQRVFANCESLTEVNLPKSLRTIDAFAFSGCKALTSIIIPKGVKEIGSSAFECCTSLSNINIPQTVGYWGTYVFTNCSSLTSIELPNKTTCVTHAMFDSCKSLSGISIPDSVEIIDTMAFQGCISLTSIYIPSSVKLIFGNTFRDCSEKLTICAPSGSYAEDYAKEQGINYVESK